MGTRWRIDEFIFGKEALNRWDREREETKNNAKLSPAPKYEEKEYEEGLFHVKKTYQNDGSGLSWNTLERTIEGKVIKFEKENFSFPAQTIHRQDKEINGVYFVLETSKGIKKVEFPYELSEIEETCITNQTIKYSHLREDYEELWGNCGDMGGCGLVTNFYKINILTGQFNGKSLEKKITN